VELLDLFIPKLRRAIKEAGILPFTKPQEEAFPHILRGENLLLVAPTGTGKTEAALLPILNNMVRVPDLWRRRGVRLLYITPLRSLNRDLLERMSWWASKLDLSVGVRHGDTTKEERTSQRFLPPHIMVTTPETLQILLVGKNLREILRTVRWVVVDEVHELLSDKRGTQLLVGLERLRLLVKGEIQVIGLSATVGEPEKLGSFLIGPGRRITVVKVPIPRGFMVEVTFPQPTEVDVALSQKLVSTPDVAARARAIIEYVRDKRAVLLFTNTRSTAELLGNRLLILDSNLPIRVHHSSLGKLTRISAEEKLKGGEIKGVVCTSSLELGIDVGRVEFVIQYGSPRQAVRLVQRVGRSGHKIGLTAKGVIISIDGDDFLESIVIKRRALNDLLEPVEPPDKPLDVLTHQIAGILITDRKLSISQLLNILRSSSPYSSLSEEELKNVLSFMSERHPPLFRYFPDLNLVMRPRGLGPLYNYYFNNLSTIPEVKQYLVVNEADESIVGVLDEEFVAEKGVPGVKFIMGGLVWRLRQVFGDRVYVEQDEDPIGAIPHWVGEEIPVPFEVAQEVGSLYGEVISRGRQDEEFEYILRDIASRYGVDPALLETSFREIWEYARLNTPMVSDRMATIEAAEDYVIIHTFFGSRVNRTISKILGTLLSRELGATILVNYDPYRVIIQAGLPPSRVLKLWDSMCKNFSEKMILEGLETTGLFRRRLLHVARRFGIIEKEADINSRILFDLARSLTGTPVFEEAVKELLTIDYDVSTTKKIISEFVEGKRVIKIVEGLHEPSPLAIRALSSSWKKMEIHTPDRAEKMILKLAEIRLLNTVLVAVCLDCKRFVGKVTVGSVGNSFKCPLCGSRKIGFLKNEEEAHIMRYQPNSPKAQRILRKLEKTARLYQKWGENFLLTYAGRGISINMVEKIIGKSMGERDTLIKFIVEAEKRRLLFVRRS